ncbi:MAG: GntR family transcriptional regulator [Chloroflexi bacterium]|nr:GntR family transcriptional regulator [Chloroflexota bacterium]
MPLERFSPLYRWLVETLREDIAQGVYKPGDALPTEYELRAQYDLSSTTVARAMNDLAREGWVYRKAGKGTFVKRAKVEERLVRLKSFVEEMQSHNITPVFKPISAQPVAPPPEIARAFNLAPDQKLYLIKRTYLAEGEPIATAQGYWALDIGEKLVQHDLRNAALYEIVERELHISLLEAEESISATCADAALARELQVTRHTPLLIRRRLTYAAEMRPVEHATTYYRADRYEYTIRLARRDI